MYFEVSAEHADQLSHAKDLIKDLVDETYEEYQKWMDEHDDKSAGKGRREDDSKRSRPPVEGEFTKTVDVIFKNHDTIESDFKVKGRLIGGQGKNLKHIRQETGASLEIEGDYPDLYFQIGADKEGVLREAEKSILDLIAAVEEQYDEWKEKGKGKGGSKGKSSQHKATVSVFHCEDAVGFKLRKMIVGSDNQNFKHIEEETGAKMELLGREDSRDGMWIEIRADRKDDLEAAVGQTEDLISSVKDSYAKYESKHKRGNRRNRDYDKDSEPSSKRHLSS